MLVTKRRYLLHRNLSKMKPTQDDYVLHPNLLHIISVILLLFHINTAQKYNSHKFRTFGMNSQKSQTNTWWLVFAPKSYAHHFRSFSCCFTPIWLKNAYTQRTGPQIRKPTKNRNQPQITTFFTQIFRT